MQLDCPRAAPSFSFCTKPTRRILGDFFKKPFGVQLGVARYRPFFLSKSLYKPSRRSATVAFLSISSLWLTHNEYTADTLSSFTSVVHLTSFCAHLFFFSFLNSIFKFCFYSHVISLSPLAEFVLNLICLFYIFSIISMRYSLFKSMFIDLIYLK